MCGVSCLQMSKASLKVDSEVVQSKKPGRSFIDVNEIFSPIFGHRRMEKQLIKGIDLYATKT